MAKRDRTNLGLFDVQNTVQQEDRLSFYTEVIVPNPRFEDPNRVADVALLEPVTRQAVQAIIAQAETMFGVTLAVFETYRSHERQTEMFDQGTSKLNVSGVHHFGLACDFVMEIGGHPSWRGGFKFLGQLARAYGLIWGGEWGFPKTPTSFPDSDHVQRCSIAKQQDLLAQTWYPDAQYNPYNG
ncbi:MAG: M15 family metallopeptidase [Rhizomicrobium sp.]